MSQSIIQHKNKWLVKQATVSRTFFLALLAILYIYLSYTTALQPFAIGSIILFIVSFRQLILAIGQRIPVLEISAVLMIGQCLISPLIDYNYYADFGFSSMYVPQDVFLAYAFPALCAFYLGLLIPLGKRKLNEKNILLRIKEDKAENIKMGVNLIAIGMFFQYAVAYLPVPNLGFVFKTFAMFRFVGVFYLWFSNSRYTLAAIMIVFIPMTLSIISGGLFFDLIVWVFFLYCFIAIKKKISAITSISIFAFGFACLAILQLVKADYREIIWFSQEEQSRSNISIFVDIVVDKVSNFDEELFIVGSYAINVRANQGTLLAWELNHIPAKEDIVYGEYFFKEVIGLIFPRFIYPSKPIVGDHDKFERLTGIRLNDQTAMNVGVLGDGYGNFGKIGGIIFCFCFGLFMNSYVRKIFELALKYKTTPLWIPVIFFYSMRAGNEFYIITNWMVKVSLIVALFYVVTNNNSIKRLFKPKLKTSNIGS